MYFTEYFSYLKDRGRTNNKGGLSKKSVVNIRGVLSSAMKFAVENDLILNNVIDHSRLPLFETKNFEPTIYTAEQIKTLLEYAEQTNSKATLFLFLEMFTGARKGELLALTWDNVNLEKGTIYICQNRTGSKKEVLEHLTTPKTRNGYRTIPLPQKVIDLLTTEKELQEHNKSVLGKYYKTYEYDYVIRQADGSIYNPNSVNRIIKKLTEQIGLPHCRIHDYRHPYVKLKLKNSSAYHCRIFGTKVLDFPLDFKPVIGIYAHLFNEHIRKCLC